MPKIYPSRPTLPTHPLVQSLLRGECIGLPSESTYEVVGAALQMRDYSRITKIASEKCLAAIVINSLPALYDWMPLLEGAVVRIVRGLNAGPLTIVADGGYRQGLWSRLPVGAQEAVVHNGRLAIRWPKGEIWSELPADLPLISVPVPTASTGDELATCAGVEVVLDGGAYSDPRGPSIIEASGRRYLVRFEGGLPADFVDELARCRILFLCTGNTCRSPMAKALCVKLLADALHCRPDELPSRDFSVESAGLAAYRGGPASPEAVQVAAEFGADLSNHRSEQASVETVAWADHIFTMTASHLSAISGVPCISTPRLLSPTGQDVSDPIGGALSDYRTCAEQIIQCLKERLPEILES